MLHLISASAGSLDSTARPAGAGSPKHSSALAEGCRPAQPRALSAFLRTSCCNEAQQLITKQQVAPINSHTLPPLRA